jgi:DMSO/TMAO reductase YedYZ molybdopterin-dependent catalytic subunit
VAGGAIVYRASDLQSGMRHVAVKLFAESQAHTRLRAEFFGRECRALHELSASVDHAYARTPRERQVRHRRLGGNMSPIISRGFRGRRDDAPSDRVPPGQYVTRDFPVLSAGPTPRTPLDRWDFSIVGEVDEPRRWTWEEFRALPSEEVTVDIHCVTKWSKLDTVWEGVSVDTLLDGIDTSAEHVVQFSDGGYTTNVPLEDVTGGKAWVAFGYDGEPLEAEHGGPARMLVPHLYFWKSAKWIRGLRLSATDEPGFWEINGYHNYGDPWKEQRYWGD